MQAELERWKDLALRGQADFDNFRKRTARDITEIRRYAAGDLLADLLPVLDNFDLGLMAARNESTDSPIALGMSMVRRQLDDFLTAQGVKEIPADGTVFDPAKHDAVATEAHESVPDGTIIRVARKGYFLHDRVLRAPSVIVSSGPAAGEA
jgi:molecular chaperone GrpE